MAAAARGGLHPTARAPFSKNAAALRGARSAPPRIMHPRVPYDEVRNGTEEHSPYVRVLEALRARDLGVIVERATGSAFGRERVIGQHWSCFRRAAARDLWI